jgi:lipoprotein-anchoring transpeptidase ErfK/SrfK
MNYKHIRIAGAAGTLALGAALAWPAPAATEPADEANAVVPISMVVDLSERKLYVRKDGDTIRTYQVAVGHPKHPTPKGNFGVQYVIWNPKWVPPDAEWAKDKEPKAPGDPKNPVGRVKMIFKQPDYYIHGTHVTESLGRAESKGCVRMRNGDVIALAKLVMENSGTHRPPAWYKRVINVATRTQEVWMSKPVPLTVKA